MQEQRPRFFCRMSLHATLQKFYTEHGRGYLPWRKTKDAYKILVSEMMLQQTQVARVIPKYHEFLHAFPTIKVLAAASFSEVLSHWSGLGYNRRARFLHEAAKVTVRDFKGILPQSVEKLMSLPGVGPYTARAVAAFAYNQPVVFIETNIRTVFIYSGVLQNTRMNKNAQISDKEILPLIEKEMRRSMLPPREFYAALMDYGSFLKRSGVRMNNKSKHYTKQSKFEGSARQLRGAILRELLKTSATAIQLSTNFAYTKFVDTHSELDILRECERLVKEGLLHKKGNKFEIKK